MAHLDDDFATLMERVRNGCPDAIAVLLQRYGGHIRKVVRQQLHQRLRPQFDSIDFQQDVWASFFCGDPQRYHFTCPEMLVRYLSAMAYHKVVEVFRQRMQSPKRNLNRERSLNELHYHKALSEATGRHPSPSQVAMAKEAWERLLTGQPPHHRRILELLRLGHTHAEIAQKLGLSPKMIQRVLNAVKQQQGEAI